ncbi:hypothetical protein [Prosthecobacter sp.]|uniref:hypothetical protein n=1 Tax=Prosthecobacter sp. TaxID=1965333 RepID=UPI001E19EE9A|nr:hypothetical protein [Prosthecobacter sp.]MCB1278535.1 hypothetical protein [Prosthecobacter sp.]
MSEPVSTPDLFSPHRRWALAGGVPSSTPVPPEAPDATAGLELFRHADAENEDGYERWRQERAHERALQESARRSEELPAQADDAGYAAWKTEAEDAKRAFEKRWGVPLGRRVRVRLSGELREREGLLRLTEESPWSGNPLFLRLGADVFEAGRIESLVRVD